MPIDHPLPGKQSDIRRGILWMIAAMLMFASVNAAAKTLTQSYPIAQVVWGRYFFQMVLLAVVLWPRLPGVVVSRRPGLQLFRSCLLFFTTALFFTGLGHIPLAEATSLMYLAPIVVTVLSVPMLGEQVGGRRWAGVVAGFAGALLIIRPGFGILALAALAPLGAAFTHGLYQITTRMLSGTDGPVTTLAYSALVGAVVSSVAVSFFWQQPDLKGWALMAVTGLCATLGHFSMIKAFAEAPASAVSPLSYTNMLWSGLYGAVLFAHIPDAWTLLGAAVIAGSGLYIFFRERRRREPEPQGAPGP